MSELGLMFPQSFPERREKSSLFPPLLYCQNLPFLLLYPLGSRLRGSRESRTTMMSSYGQEVSSVNDEDTLQHDKEPGSENGWEPSLE